MNQEHGLRRLARSDLRLPSVIHKFFTVLLLAGGLWQEKNKCQTR